MSHSTPLDKIENDVADGGNASDAVRVQRILQEINGGGDEAPGQQQQQQMQMQQQQQQQMYQEQQQQQGPPPGYHMYQPPHAMPPQQLMGPGMVPYGNQHEQRGPPQYEQEEPQREPPPPPAPAKKNVWAHITDALKLPVVVAFVFFLLSLPIVDVYLSKYAHWAFSSGGQLSLPGIALKAVVAGTVMGIYDTLDSFVSRFF